MSTTSSPTETKDGKAPPPRRAHSHSVLIHPGGTGKWSERWKDGELCSNRLCENPKFSMTRRKHHCRFCAEVYCDKCSPKIKVPANLFPFMDEKPVNGEHNVRRCNKCAVPRCFTAYSSRPNGALKCGAMDAILKYSDSKTINNLLQSSNAMHGGFHAKGVPYLKSCQERFPSLWEGAKIGKGGCGTVFRVEDRQNQGKEIAVKLVEKPSIFCWFVWRRMLLEISIMKGNKHENVAGLLEQYQTPTQLILVLEIGGGGSLRHGYDIMKRKHYNMELFIAHMIKYSIKGLDYLYRERSVVHRDIKAENIVLSTDFSRVMIIDFGLAEVITPNKPQTFVPCGTVGYASPENIAAVVERKKVFGASGDTMHAADIFSLGVVAFILLSGTKPLKGTRFNDLHNEVRRGIRCDGQRWADISKDAKDLLEWMLHSNTQQRATVQDCLSHPFIVKHADSFKGISQELALDAKNSDAKEEEEWDQVTPEASGAWMFAEVLEEEEPEGILKLSGDDEDGTTNAGGSSGGARGSGKKAANGGTPVDQDDLLGGETKKAPDGDGSLNVLLGDGEKNEAPQQQGDRDENHELL